MIQVLAWQVDFHSGKLDLGLLVPTDTLKGILKLYTVPHDCEAPGSFVGFYCVS